MGYLRDAKKAGLHEPTPERLTEIAEKKERNKGQKWVPADGEGVRFYGYDTPGSTQRNLEFPHSLTLERPRIPLPEVSIEPAEE